MCIKIDLTKAFDSVSWSFIAAALIILKFPVSFSQRVLECISTPWFSLLINGSPQGYFEGKKGLRQGDPLSPYLFVIGMEFLSRYLKLKLAAQHYHPRCADLQLSHLFFADDLLIFARGDVSSITAIMQCLDDFSKLSGLNVNKTKTEIYFGGVKTRTKAQILKKSGFAEGSLPFRYLGLPLNARRLSTNDCQSLLDKITKSILHWSTKNLSYAGRIQLLNTVIFGVSNFWCGVPIIPQNVLKKINQLCSQFLWGSIGKRKFIFLGWESICKPKKLGGVGIKEILSWYNARTVGWIHKISTQAPSLWLRWVQSKYIRGENFWDIPCRPSDSVAWKAVLKSRDKVKLLAGSHSPADLLNTWCSHGNFRPSKAYIAFSTAASEVTWSSIIWNSVAIPRHAFISYLAIKNSLATLDNLQLRGIHLANCCVLCQASSESCSHLFFACDLSRSIWQQVLNCLNVQRRPLSFKHEVRWARQAYRKKDHRSRKLICALHACVYEIWIERNLRTFHDKERSISQILGKIMWNVETRMTKYGKSDGMRSN